MRIAKIVSAVVASAALFAVGYMSHSTTPAAPAVTRVVQTTDDVTSFNNGYREAMQEAQQNGPEYVAQWLTETR